MKKIVILVCIFFFISKVLEAQIPLDSLKNTCKFLHMQEIDSILQESKNDKTPYYEINELFYRYSNTNRIFFVLCRLPGYTVHTPTIYQFYLLNSITGRQINLNSIEDFNDAIGRNKKICNLDKCYLYLYFNEKITSSTTLTSPMDYNKSLNSHSVFLKDALRIFTKYCSSCISVAYREHISSDISQSTKGYICVYAMIMVQPYHYKLTKYQFYFDRHGELNKVFKSVIK